LGSRGLLGKLVKRSQQPAVAAMAGVEPERVHLAQRLLGIEALDANAVKRAKEQRALLPQATVDQDRVAARVAHQVEKTLNLLGGGGGQRVERGERGAG